MAQITASLVKELREKSGAGMMDCKKALDETQGDLEQAVDWLRKKGLATAAKKAGRTAADGLVGIAAEGTKAAIVEVNSETDFVARNEQFQGFVRDAAKAALGAGDAEALKAAGYPGKGRSVSEELTELVATIGENMTIRRSAELSVSEGVVATYLHTAMGEGVGKIGVLVALESAGKTDELQALGRQLAMHIAAAAPASLNVAELDPEAVEREKTVLRDQALASGKPADIVEKMLEGRLRKFYQEVVLLEQTFIIDNERPVSKVVADAEKQVGAPVKLTGFVRFKVGEGIEKEEVDFAAEVARTVAG